MLILLGVWYTEDIWTTKEQQQQQQNQIMKDNHQLQRWTYW